MRVNSKKTQVLCIHSNVDSTVSSFINTHEGKIESGSSLKILGFNFSNAPNAVHHVCTVIDKFYRKLWTLRYLRKSGMDSSNMLKVYKTVILPSVEYCSEIYDSLIPAYLADKLELVQKQCMKIIFGYNVQYGQLLENGTIETLSDRRKAACLRFANKVVDTPFGQKWFPRNTASREVRQTTRRVYLEKKHKTERSKNNPIQHMIRLLNLQLSE